MVSSLIDKYGAAGSDTARHDTFAVVEFYLYDPAYRTEWGDDRIDWYDVYQQPTFIYDGLWESTPQTSYKSDFVDRQSVETDVTLELSGDQVSGSTFDITLDICVEAGGGTSKTMRIYMVQVLDHWPLFPAPNDYHRNTLVQSAYNPHGTEPVITLAPGECTTIVRELTFNATSWSQQSDIQIIAWAQEDGTPPPAAYPFIPDVEVYQAAVMAWPFPPSNVCELPGDMDENGKLNGDDIPGFLRAKLGFPPIGDENPACAEISIEEFVGYLLD